MTLLRVALGFLFFASYSSQQEKCEVAVACEQPDGSTTYGSMYLPSGREVKNWKQDAERAQNRKDCGEPGWLTGQGGQYQYMVGEASLDWDTARKYCMMKGADLAYDGLRMGDNMKYLTDRLKGHNIRGFWIGLTDSAKEGEWRWIDGRVLSNTGNWGNNQPDNNNGNQNCGWISRDFNYNFDDGECFAHFNPLCERLI